MIDTRARRLSVAFLTLVTFIGPFASGCGEPEPPPVSGDQLDAAKKDREEIIQKEYGGGAEAPK